jgi:hypothetical protein
MIIFKKNTEFNKIFRIPFNEIKISLDYLDFIIFNFINISLGLRGSAIPIL